MMIFSQIREENKTTTVYKATEATSTQGES